MGDSHGVDLFYIQLALSRTYDSLTDEFNCCCAVVLGFFFAKYSFVFLRARASTGYLMGRAIRAGPARSGLYRAVLGKRYGPVGRHGPARLSGRA
jgi:hypothetical protein